MLFWLSTLLISQNKSLSMNNLLLLTLVLKIPCNQMCLWLLLLFRQIMRMKFLLLQEPSVEFSFAVQKELSTESTAQMSRGFQPFKRPTEALPIIIPPIVFPPGTTFGDGAGTSSVIHDSSAAIGKKLVVRSDDQPEQDVEEEAGFSFSDAARLDSALLHLSELNHIVSQLKQDHHRRL